jgi:arylsulfatase A-like enzyme
VVTNSQISAHGLHFEQGFHRFLTPRALGISAGTNTSEETSRKATDAIAPWLGRESDEPFFLYIHTLDPHIPYAPPPAQRGTFTADYDGPLQEQFLDLPALWKLVEKDARTGAVSLLASERDLEYIKETYDEEILGQDAQIERLLGMLEAQHLRERTILVFYSDHGEEFQEHHRWDHRGRMWDVHLRVPLIVWIPPTLRDGLLPPGARITAPVSQVDLVPTILELLGVDDLAPRQGRSLVPLLRGEPLEPTPIYASEDPELGALIDGDSKLIWTPGTTDPAWQLYRLDQDPAERHDLAELDPAELERLKQLRDAFRAGQRAKGFHPPSIREAIEYDPWEKAHLQALGYLEEE